MSAGRLRRVIIESSSDEDEPPSSPRAAETFLSDDDMNSPKTTSRGLFDSFLCPKSEPRGNNHEDSFSNFITDDESENNSISVLEQSMRSVSVADASMRSLPNTPRLQPPRSAKEFLRQPQFFEHSEAIEETSLEDKENVNDESATSEDFEKYLQGLRKQPQDIPSDDENEIDDSEFVVSDDHVSEESGEITDEEEVLELSESESDEKSKPSRPKDVVLLSNLKQAFESPSVKAPRIAKKCSSEWFLQSLADSYNHLRHPDAEQIFRKGVKHVQTRDLLVLKLFTIFRNECFSDKLPEDLKIGWKPRLTKTAGLCSCRLGRAEIWLSTKVCTTPERIRDTLVHEMCHAAVYLIDRVSNHQHGPLWKAWAARCMKRFRSLPLVSRCHDYEINAKFVYVCVGCEQRIHRHSKSLDITRKICGICKGRFVLRTESKAPSAFAVFVQKYYKEEKITGRSHREIMKILSGRFKKSKDRTGEKEEEEEEEIVSQNLDISILSIHE